MAALFLYCSIKVCLLLSYTCAFDHMLFSGLIHVTIGHTLALCALCKQQLYQSVALSFPVSLLRNWILPANPYSPGSFLPPPSVQSFSCSVQQLCSSQPALQYVLLIPSLFSVLLWIEKKKF